MLNPTADGSNMDNLSEPLKPGDTIGFITPSSPMMPGRLEAGIPYLEAKGYKVKLGKHVHDSNRFLAGTDEDRAQDIMDFFTDPEIKVILATGGGYGSQRLLPLLNYDLIRANPKFVVGRSDTTALQLGLLKKAGIISCSGFVLGDIQNEGIHVIEDSLFKILKNEPFQIKAGKTIREGIAEGLLIGGNLELIIALIGTPYQPDYLNNILFMEDVRQEPYKIDCMLSQLYMAGIFDQVSGVVFCQFTDCKANYFPERDGTVTEVIDDWTLKLRVPCIKDFPHGHGEQEYALPIGRRVRLDAANRILVFSS